MRKSTGLFLLSRDFCTILLISCLACSPKKEVKPTDPIMAELSRKPFSIEESKVLFGELADNWFFGPGVGRAAWSIGSIVAFPPLAVYFLATGITEAIGYQPVYWSDLLPDEGRKPLLGFYGLVTDAPGSLFAAMAEKEFRASEVVRTRMKLFVEERQQQELDSSPESQSSGK